MAAERATPGHGRVDPGRAPLPERTVHRLPLRLMAAPRVGSQPDGAAVNRAEKSRRRDSNRRARAARRANRKRG